jgi:hypothetical protein
MPRSIAARRGTYLHKANPERCLSKHEGMRRGRPHPSRCAHARSNLRTRLRIRAPQDEDGDRVQVLFTFQTAHFVPAARFAPGFCIFGFAHPRRRGGGAPRVVRVLGHPWACTIGAGQAPSEAPCVPIRGTPASRRSHRGDFRRWGRASPHRHCGRIGHSELPRPGRSARRGAPASRGDGCEPSPRLAPPSGCLRTTPLEEQGWEDSYYTSQNAVNRKLRYVVTRISPRGSWKPAGQV